MPFDSEAPEYDQHFTHSRIGALLRRATWRRFDARFQPGQRVLELNCGTGEDAAYLARKGVRVLATDASAKMIEQTRLKAARAGLSDLIETRQLALEDLSKLQDGPFDGALSNFGGLNCVGDLPSVARALAKRLRPGAALVVCVMGPVVPWEWVWFLSHAQPSKAFRRLRRGGVEWRGMQIRYPSIRKLRSAFSPAFSVTRLSALGALIPPPYTETWSIRFPRCVDLLNRWERSLETMPPLPWLADHYLLEFEQR